MDNSERDKLIAKMIGEGRSLSDVQRLLKEEHGIQLTYMELRLISSELNVNWEKIDTANAKSVDKVVDAKAADDDDMLGAGRTVVNVSKVVRPGAVMSGDVRFKSGRTAEWQLDPLGRLGLNPTNNSEKPSEEDLREFQMELQHVLQGKF